MTVPLKQLEASGGLTGVILISGSTVTSHATITAALAAAVFGDLVLVGPGTYAESFTVPSGVLLRSVGGATVTTISGALATGTRVTLTGTNAVIKGFSVTLPTDAVPAITYAGSTAASASGIQLAGAGASGKGITNTGTGVLTAIDVAYLSGACDIVFESTGGTLVVLSSTVVGFGAVAAAFCVSGGGVLEVFTGIVSNANVVDAIQCADGKMELTGVGVEAATTALHVTHNSADVAVSSFRVRDVVTNHLLVDAAIAPVRINISAAEMDRRKISHDAGTNIVLQFLDQTPGDKALVIHGELAVGKRGEGSESVFGEGDSYVMGMEVKTNTNLEVGAWATITDAMKSSSGSTAAAFPGVGVGNAVYFGGDIKFPGVKVDTTAAIALGAGALIWEYWDGSAWQLFKVMAADAESVLPPAAYAQDVFGRVAHEQVRWNDRAFTTWTAKALDGETKFWVRARISTAITTAPTLEQVKLHSNRTEINANGVLEHFGTAEPFKSFGWHQRHMNDLTGSTSGNNSLTLTTNIGVDGIDNALANNAVDGIAAIIEVPEGLDTSRPINLTFNWIPVSGSGDVEFESHSGPIALGDTLDGALLDTLQSKIVTAPAAEVLSQDFFDYDVADLVAGEMIAVSLFRDATGGNLDDTLNGAVTLGSIDVHGTFWR